MSLDPKQGSSTISGGLDSREKWCPPCELFFRNLEEAHEDGNGKLSQVVRVQERGEPKSGTGFMFDWAMGTVVHTCNYMKGLYGEAKRVC